MRISSTPTINSHNSHLTQLAQFKSAPSAQLDKVRFGAGTAQLNQSFSEKYSGLQLFERQGSQQLKQKERQELQDFIKTNLPFTEHLEKALQEPETRILSVRDKEHRLVATALLCSEKDEKTGKREGLIRSVAVDPNFRGQKIAPWLVSYLIQKAKVQGYPSLVLVTYNPTAKKIYEKMGFDLYWGPDQYENVKMRLTLNQPIPANVKQKSSLWERLKEMGSRAIRWSKSLLKAVLRFLHLNQKKKPA